MVFSATKTAGALLFVAAIQFIVATLIAEALYPNYSTSLNYISDLGVWAQASAAFFNPAIIASGVITLICAYLLKGRLGSRVFPVLLALTGIGSVGVGVFPEDTFIVYGIPVIHSVAAFLTFIFGAAAALAAYRITRSPFRYISAFLGAFSLVAFALLIITGGSGFLIVGAGTLERLVAYPQLLWTVGFAGYLLGSN